MALTFDEWYYNGNPAGYARYSREMWATDYSFGGFAQRTIDEAARRGHSITNKGVLVVGCAYGFMVEELRARGVPAWGADISTYALSQAPGTVAPFVVQADARPTNGLEPARTLAGLKGKQTFDLIVDEDMLTCLTDVEAINACTEMRRIGSKVAHRLSVHTVDVPDYNIKALPIWKTLCDPTSADWWFVYTTWAEG